MKCYTASPRYSAMLPQK